MPETTLAKKLRILPGNRLLLLNAPDGYLTLLAPLPDGVEVASGATEHTGTFDVVQAFTHDRAALDRLWPTALAATRPGGVLWICWPKQSAKLATDLDRDALWAAVHTHGWSGVTSVSVNATWSALRFRPHEEVGR